MTELELLAFVTMIFGGGLFIGAYIGYRYAAAEKGQ